jgi:hypothetical protein
MKLRLILVGLLLVRCAWAAEESWRAILNRMPLGTNISVLNQTNCAQVLLGGFQSNATAKALIFMSGATDELYFFRRVQVKVTNAAPTLLDAVVALTNQSPLRVTFRAPFVMLYSAEDVLDLDFKVQHAATEKKLKTARPLARLLAIDRDWTQLLQLMKRKIPTTLLPYEGTTASWHFYRHTFAGWNLTPWETLEAVALAGKTRFTVIRRGVVFEVDPRVGKPPKLERFPGH